MKKILFVITKLSGGGAERALCNLTFAMPENVEYDILVSCESEYDYPHKGNVISLGMKPVGKLTLAFQIKSFINRIIALKKLKKSKGYHACISFMDSANVANILTGRRYCKTIVSVRNTLSQKRSKEYKYIINPLAKMLYPYADKVISLSKGTEWDLKENFGISPQKLETIYNGYNFDLIDKSILEGSRIKTDDNYFYYITVGRLCEQKGQWHLIRAFGSVVKKYPECRLIICGTGGYDGFLKDMADKYGLSDKVIFTGLISNPFALSVKCDVFVFPSLYEGFGNVMIENMHCGLPVISADYRYGAREILAPDTDFRIEQCNEIEMAEYGILTPVCSGKKSGIGEPLEKEEKLLAQAMILLREDPGLREKYSKQSKKRAMDFDIQQIVGQWLGHC